ncbi:MAG: MFS transporter [Clostridia bacterium]|nr:MFS transporter [Clostridia bacterium]
MKNQSSVVKSSITMLWLCFFVYAILSMMKTAFSSSMAAIIHDGIFTNSEAGIINACFYFLYGLAQLFGAKMIDKTSPMTFLTIALLSAALSALGMAFAGSFAAMLVIWSLCGLLQFAAWPCTIKIIAEYLLDTHRHKAMTIIAFAYCFGNLLNYFFASIILNLASWRYIFIIDAIILGIMLIIWLIPGMKASKVLTGESVEKNIYDSKMHQNDNAPEISYIKLLRVSGILILLITGFIRTALDLGIKSWAPTLMVQSYGISPSFATTLTTILMVINLSGVFIANFIYPKYFKNVISALCTCFIICMPASIAMLFIGKIPLWSVVIMLIFFTTMMYCGNQLINVVVPSFFNKYNRSGSIAGILNAAASFGAVASNFGYGLLADKFGWSGTILSWSVMGIISIISCIIIVPIWTKFTKR